MELMLGVSGRPGGRRTWKDGLELECNRLGVILLFLKSKTLDFPWDTYYTSLVS